MTDHEGSASVIGGSSANSGPAVVASRTAFCIGSGLVFSLYTRWGTARIGNLVHGPPADPVVPPCHVQFSAIEASR
jgi:hypothetical protein